MSSRYSSLRQRWEVTVQDNSFHYHTEVALTGEKITDYKCNCIPYSQGNFCSHLAATFIHIRSRTSENEEVAEPKKTKVSRKAAPSFKNFIELLSIDELRGFIRDHARTDAWLKQKIQARFYDRKTDEEKERYIESLFPVVTSSSAKVPMRRITSFIKISEELNDQFKGFVQQLDFLEAYRLTFLLLKKSFYIKFNQAKNHDAFLKNHEVILKNYHEIHTLIDAPDFKAAAAGELIDFLSSSYVTLHSKLEKDLWIKVLNTAERRDELLDIIQSALSVPVKDINTYNFMQATQLMVLDSKSKIQRISKFSGQEIYRVIHHLLDYKEISSAQEALRSILAHYPLSYSLARQILEILPAWTLRAKEKELVLSFFMKYKKRFFINWLKQEAAFTLADVKKNPLFETISADPGLHLDILCTYEQYEAAGAILKVQSDQDLLRRYDRELAAYDPEIIQEAYLFHARKYLSEHFGTQARQYIKELVRHLDIILPKSSVRHIERILASLLPGKKSKARR